MIKKVIIHIGEYYASNQTTVISTVLGSCVAVCFFDPVQKIGGMNHILLPGKPILSENNSSARYGINAMELLINGIMSLGGDRRRLSAKIFGGAHILSTIPEENGMGKKNSDFVIEFLNYENIKIVSMDIGGTQTRKIYFHTSTGEVLLKYIPSMFNISKKEVLKLKRIRNDIYKPGEVTIFKE